MFKCPCQCAGFHTGMFTYQRKVTFVSGVYLKEKSFFCKITLIEINIFLSQFETYSIIVIFMNEVSCVAE